MQLHPQWIVAAAAAIAAATLTSLKLGARALHPQAEAWSRISALKHAAYHTACRTLKPVPTTPLAAHSNHLPHHFLHTHTVWSSVTSAILGEKGMGMFRGLVYLRRKKTGEAHRLFRDAQAGGLRVWSVQHTQESRKSRQAPLGMAGTGLGALRVWSTHRRAGRADRLLMGAQLATAPTEAPLWPKVWDGSRTCSSDITSSQHHGFWAKAERLRE